MDKAFELAGKIIEIGTDKYKIYHTNKEYVFMCKLGTSKLELIVSPIKDIHEKIIIGDYNLSEPEPPMEINEEKMTENELYIYKTRKAFIADVDKEFGPDFMDLQVGDRSKDFRAIYDKHEISKKTAWKVVRSYLQAGKCDEGLIDQRIRHKVARKYNYTRKTGRPYMEGTVARGLVLTEELEKIFEEYTKKYLRNRSMTLVKAYQIMIANEFSYHTDDGGIQPYPASERPTKNQFIYYVNTHTSKEERDTSLLSAREVRNDKRLLVGSTRTEIIRPGAVIELDTLEADISLVSEADRTQSIGRGILYMAVDVMTGAIVAVSAGLENNSLLGLTSLFMNFFDDKQDFAAEYGIRFSSNLWPSNFIPETFRTDYGADYISKGAQEICKRIGIHLEDVPPGTGSMKPIIEQSFHQFQASFRASVEGKGLITKRYDSNHHAEACMTISDFNKMVIAYIVHYNQKATESRKLEKELIEQGIMPIPIKLWEYYAQRNGAPEPINPDRRSELFYKLMLDGEASLSRDGITFKELKYINNTPELNSRMYKAGKNRESIQIKYDPRSVDSIYYIDAESRYVEAHLNEKKEAMESYKGMTFAQYGQYLDKGKIMAAKVEEHNLITEISMNNSVDTIVRNAEDSTPLGKAKTKNMRKVREQEKQAVNYENRISKRLDTNIDEPCEDIEIETEQKATELKPYDTPEEARLVAMQNYYDVD